MSDRKDLGRRLRDADPAEGAELGRRERAEMRREVVGAAEKRPGRGSVPWKVGWMAAAAVAAVLVLGRGLLRPLGTVPPASAARETPAVAQRPLLDETPFAAVTRAEARPAKPSRTLHQLRPRVASERPVGAQATRIMFTAPGGTRILWFAGGRTAKEEAS